MLACPQADCGWRAVAPSRRAALSELAEHLVDEHGTVVDADVPEGAVRVREDGEWTTVPVDDVGGEGTRGDGHGDADGREDAGGSGDVDGKEDAGGDGDAGGNRDASGDGNAGGDGNADGKEDAGGDGNAGGKADADGDHDAVD